MSAEQDTAAKSGKKLSALLVMGKRRLSTVWQILKFLRE